MSKDDKKTVVWHRVPGPEGLEDGRVVTAVALSKMGGEYGAIDNHCPHQGGPLGEGSTEVGELNFYGIRHEGAASFACSAYATLTGKPPVCFTIAGPGATNLMTGLYDAKVDRARVLAMTDAVLV